MNVPASPARRGMSILQPALILVAVLFGVLAVKQFLQHDGSAQTAEAAPAKAEAPAAGGKPVADAPLPLPPGVLPGSSIEALKKFDDIRDEVRDAFAASVIAYREPRGPRFREMYDAGVEHLQERYAIVPHDGAAGAKMTLFLPHDPRNKVILAIAGPDELANVAVDGGQFVPTTAEGQALAALAAGLARVSPKTVLAACGRYTPAEPARAVYDAQLQVASKLADRYGRGNVMVVGHSHGGGGATYIGALLGVRTVAFNAIPLGPTNQDTVARFGVPVPDQKITQVNVAGEFVSTMSPGRQYGETFTVPGKSAGWRAAGLNHRLENFLLEKPIRYTSAVKEIR